MWEAQTPTSCFFSRPTSPHLQLGFRCFVSFCIIWIHLAHGSKAQYTAEHPNGPLTSTTVGWYSSPKRFWPTAILKQSLMLCQERLGVLVVTKHHPQKRIDVLDGNSPLRYAPGWTTKRRHKSSKKLQKPSYLQWYTLIHFATWPSLGLPSMVYSSLILCTWHWNIGLAHICACNIEIDWDRDA